MAPRKRRRIAAERVARAAHKAGIAFIADRLRESSSAVSRPRDGAFIFVCRILPRNKMIVQ